MGVYGVEVNKLSNKCILDKKCTFKNKKLPSLGQFTAPFRCYSWYFRDFLIQDASSLKKVNERWDRLTVLWLVRTRSILHHMTFIDEIEQFDWLEYQWEPTWPAYSRQLITLAFLLDLHSKLITLNVVKWRMHAESNLMHRLLTLLYISLPFRYWPQKYTLVINFAVVEISWLMCYEVQINRMWEPIRG